MAFALHRCEAPARRQIENPPSRVVAESQVVSVAYLVWPLAIYARIAPRPDATTWFQYHLRQALWFGNLSALMALVALVWPLVISLLVTNVVATIWIYVLAMLIDVALFVLWLVLAIRYSQRAARGELFEVPVVSKITGGLTGTRK